MQSDWTATIVGADRSLMPDVYVTISQRVREIGRLCQTRCMAVLDHCNGVVSKKTPQIFLPSSPAEHVTAFLE